MSFWSRIERRIEDFAGDLLPDEFRERLSQARILLRDGSLADAEERLLELVSIRPDHAAAQVLLGVTLLKQGQYQRAGDAFDAALGQSDDIPEALIGRGNAALHLDNASEAVPYFRAAIDATGGDRELLSEAYHGLGLAYRRAGDLDKAIRELRKAVAESDDDATTIADLVDALSVDTTRSNREARRYLERLADRDGCPPVAWLALGRIGLHDGDSVGAIRYFERVIQGSDQADDSEQFSSANRDLIRQAFLGIADSHLQIDEGIKAEEALLHAQECGDKNTTTLAKLGEAKLLQHDEDAAMVYFKRSLEGQTGQTSHTKTAQLALALALRIGDVATGVAMANRVLAANSNDANALTARGLDLYAQGQMLAARATYKEALSSGNHFEALLAISSLELREGNHKPATIYARQALQIHPSNTRARDKLAECQSIGLGVRLQEESGWYDLAAAIGKLCSQEPELVDLVSDAGVAIAEFDQPLLVAVMGEFSSGKSSFVNAFVGADVAPTGITPTTATINIVKYGRSRGGRVVYRDNTSRELRGDDLSLALSKIDDSEARRIQHVEILMPVDVLERVNIIDTPGLNSILPEHEAVAREFLKRADAVVWLFTVNQAGKSTEKRALDSIRETGVRVLGVLNKVDQLQAKEVDEVLAYVKRELGDRVEACIPISARRAIEGAEDSGWHVMQQQLESRFFEQARQLKRQALSRRLTSLLSRAQNAADAKLSVRSARSRALRNASEEASKKMLAFVEDVVEQERKAIGRDAGMLYRTAAREVLELVRPRKLPFGSHKATKADRDYLLGLLDSGFETLLIESQNRCSAHLRQSTDEVLKPNRDRLGGVWQTLDASIDESLRLVEAEVFHRCLAFVQGYLRGGFVDHFFQVELGKMDLSEDSIYHALFRAAPELDSQISVPLAIAGGRLLGDLAKRLEDLSDIAEVEAFEMDSGLHQAVKSLAQHHSRLIETCV